ncbi:MAG: DNA polymerase II [Candidatus Hydrogenedentota bacterium]
MHNTSIDAFILTRETRDGASGLEYTLWCATPGGPAQLVFTNQSASCFVAHGTTIDGGFRRETTDLVALNGAHVDRLHFNSRRDLIQFAEKSNSTGLQLFESDVKPLDRFLMDREIRGALHIEGDAEQREGHLRFVNPAITASDYRPTLKIASIDIETEGLQGALYSIACAGPDSERVFMAGPGVSNGVIQFCGNERGLLAAFSEWIHAYDPDVLIGWNIVGFDLTFLVRKARELGMRLRLGRANGDCAVLPPATTRQSPMARILGRVVLDGIDLLRAAAFGFEQFSLEHVANELLGRGKLIQPEQNKLEEIRRLFREDRRALAEYNLEDCRLVLGIFEKAGLMHFAIERSLLMGHTLDRQGGSVAAFDWRYLPRLHRAGYVALDTGAGDEPVSSPGGYVMDSKPGIYDNVLLFDFKSLYPSIVRTFCIDPLGMAFPGEDPVPGFKGATFNRHRHILPGLIEELWAARDRAKRDANKPLSYAIKIMMNSFYGVLGTPGCRFFHPKLASSVTLRGHEVLTQSRDYIQGRGYEVIYGDTDSLFVLVGPGPSEEDCAALGRSLANDMNSWWRERIAQEHRLASHLEIEYETHFLKFFMPTVRGSSEGSKKRYAGAIRAPSGETELVFRGLESVRTDWTPLARRFQRELYARVFAGEPFDDYIRGVAAGLAEGKLDDELYYRKRVRRKLADYTKNVPPHVRAARQLDNPGRWVTYAITVNGPEPMEKRISSFDYGHYLDRQLAPVADAILQCFETSFEALTARQMEMF